MYDSIYFCTLSNNSLIVFLIGSLEVESKNYTVTDTVLGIYRIHGN